MIVGVGSWKINLWLRKLAEDLSFIPSTHMRHLTNTVAPVSGDLLVSWGNRAHIHIHLSRQIIKIISKCLRVGSGCTQLGRVREMNCVPGDRVRGHLAGGCPGRLAIVVSSEVPRAGSCDEDLVPSWWGSSERYWKL